jgi:S-adenosyl-L-methionine hydrolase (adenosine-forming)
MSLARHRKNPAAPITARPIVTLTSDFGLRDAYVASMKAQICRICDRARLIDVSHGVPAQDILCGSIVLERAVDGFPAGTTHLAVVDPGVGTDRRLLIVAVNRQFVVCPDNGLITWTWRMHPGAIAHELIWRPAKYSATFHGRDVLAPVAGMLADGQSLETLTRPIDDPILFDITPACATDTSGQIIHIDQFGNATSNISARMLPAESKLQVQLRGKRVRPLRLKRTYWDVAPGKPLALIGSSGLLEIAVRDGSAARELKLAVGDLINIKS